MDFSLSYRIYLLYGNSTYSTSSNRSAVYHSRRRGWILDFFTLHASLQPKQPFSKPAVKGDLGLPYAIGHQSTVEYLVNALACLAAMCSPSDYRQQIHFPTVTLQ